MLPIVVLDFHFAQDLTCKLVRMAGFVSGNPNVFVKAQLSKLGVKVRHAAKVGVAIWPQLKMPMKDEFRYKKTCSANDVL